jgi:predicted O-methyltransferase YrrM
MQIIPKRNALRKTVLLYRRVLRHKGYGVHSPFVYNLITKVVEERCPYYHFSDIELLRRQLRLHPAAGIASDQAIRPKQGALLFRLTNYFRPRHILQIGASVGLSTLYLTSYAQGLKCVTLEKAPAYALVAREVYAKGARTPIELHVGDYETLLPGILKKMKTLDFVFFNTPREDANLSLFDACLACAKDETVFVFKGIKANRRMREAWKTLCAYPEVTVTLDLYSMGIVFLNKKLHKRNYTAYF